MNKFTLSGEQVQALFQLLVILNLEALRDGNIEVNPFILQEFVFTPEHGKTIEKLFYDEDFGIGGTPDTVSE